ncbi:small ribosomal subunit protein uS15m isoform X2 [Anabrus simplex]|uniref:small ribosomal subunit protein uS15m isoform X2 n=1 Tax=Anabrus simplex TaxID=316456 RepID=UPI0035A26C39
MTITMSCAVIFPNQLRKAEIKYELSIRGVKPARTLAECAALLSTKTQMPVNPSFVLPYNVDAHVKRIFSLEFMPRNKTMAFFRADLVNSVKRHALDRSSMEARIAAMTGGIRDMQASMETCSRNKKTKVRLKELIDKRKKYLKYLRRWDYKRFEWLLEKLDLVFRPPPDHFHWVTRKDSLRKLTDRYCEKIKEERLASYRESLESQKAAFLQEKAAKLKWIIEEEEACGIKPSFNQNDIDKVLKQLKELEIGQGIIRET